MIVRCKATGVYHLKSFGHGFITLDINQATRHNDTSEVRAEFTRCYDFELEFISVN